MFLGSVLALVIAALVSSKATFGNMQPLWGFHKSDALVALADGSYTSIDSFARHGGIGIASSILATFAIAPWTFVGFVVFVLFMVLQLIPIPGLSGVHFGKESYVLLVVWIVLGIIFYLKQIKYLRPESSANNHYTKDI
mgnify:CR=1 FL=1